MVDREPNEIPREPVTTERARLVPAATVRIGRRGHQPGVFVAITAAFLVLAIAKPWAGPAQPRPLVQSSFVLPSAATPDGATVIDPIAQALEVQCGEPLGWRVFTHEDFLGRTFRTWRSVVPMVSASGPLDPAVPVIQVGPTIEALGYCSPWTDGERPPVGVTVSAWRIAAATTPDPTAQAVPLESIIPEWPIDLGALFSPGTSGATVSARDRAPFAVGTGARSWSIGRYVFAIRAPGWERWWAVNISRPGQA